MARAEPSGSKKRLTPHVARQLREMILTGTFRGGDRLRAEHLAEELDVSATPVREALMTMAGEGFVDFSPGRGFRVVPLTRSELIDVYDMQAHISGILAARAVPKLSTSDLDLIDTCQAALNDAITDNDARRIEECDFEIHRVINRAAAAPKLQWMLSLTLQYVPFGAHAEIPGWPEAARDDHVPLLHALRMGSEASTRDFMQAHIRHAGDLLVELLSARGVLVD